MGFCGNRTEECDLLELLEQKFSQRPGAPKGSLRGSGSGRNPHGGGQNGYFGIPFFLVGVGEFTNDRTYFCGDWDVHWGCSSSICLRIFALFIVLSPVGVKGNLSLLEMFCFPRALKLNGSHCRTEGTHIEVFGGLKNHRFAP